MVVEIEKVLNLIDEQRQQVFKMPLRPDELEKVLHPLYQMEREVLKWKAENK